MRLNRILEGIYTVSSIAGAAALSFNNPYGWLGFLLANLIGLGLFIRTQMYMVMLTQLVFLATTINGIYNNLEVIL